MCASIECAPRVFQIPKCEQDEALVALMMPFDESFHATCETVKNVAKELNLRCERADDIWHCSEIIQDVFELIYKSSFVVCDFSGKNPNVFYEAGIAHTLGRIVIPIVQNESDVPFNLRHHRHIQYLPNTEGLEKLAAELRKRIKALQEETAISGVKRSGCPSAVAHNDKNQTPQEQAPYDPLKVDDWRPENW